MSRIIVLALSIQFVLPGQDAVPPIAREKELLVLIERLEQRIAALERKTASLPDAQPAAAAATRVQEEPAVPEPAAAATAPVAANALEGTTFNFYFDGNYTWSANRPVGRVNYLRAYDVQHNSFSISQAGMIIERLARPEAGRRWGYRLDLMYGTATETLQGGGQNEPRPQVYRALFQAYGTYVAPLGSGLTLDFGKWAGSLGYEGNYAKDQISYSRGYFFHFLPYYHMGLRASYPVHRRLSLGYWLVNGVNQTEDFNGFKSQLAQAVVRPASSLTWTLQYYAGQERRDLVPALNPGISPIPSQPGLSVTQVRPVEDGRTHILNTYAGWTPHRRLTFAGELNYVLTRTFASSEPRRAGGGAAWARVQLSPRTYFGQRYTRLNDRSGLFGGVSQNLNELTSTFGVQPAPGFEFRVEYRRDSSNRPFFLTSEPGRLSTAQNTVAAGLLWWFGGKEGGW